MNHTKTLLLVDDQVLFRESLALMLRQRLPQVRVLEAGSLHVALRRCAEEAAIDLVVLDLELRDSRGLMTLERLRAARPGLAVMVLSGTLDDSMAGETRQRGALGFLSKTSRADTLVEALQRALPGREPAARPAEPVEALSGRQHEVLGLLVAGKSNKLICRELAVSEATVKTHLQAIFRKLDVNSRTQAVVAAVRLGLHAPAQVPVALPGR